jgi:soluble lytic murein transglycosylase-like protein
MPYSTAQLKQIVIDAARRYGINERIALAQINQESGFRPNVGSSAGAFGIAQFLASTAAAYGLRDRSDPVSSMEAWGKYMRHLLDKFGGDYRLALAGYHSGEGAARAALRNPAGNPKTVHYVTTIMNAAGVLSATSAATSGAGALLAAATNTATTPATWGVGGLLLAALGLLLVKELID